MTWTLSARYGSLAWNDELEGDVDVLEEWSARVRTVDATPTGPTLSISPLPDDEVVVWYAAIVWAESEGGGVRSSSPPKDHELWDDDVPDDAIF